MPPAWDGHSCIRSTRRTTISPSFARCRTGSCAISSPALKASLRWLRLAGLFTSLNSKNHDLAELRSMQDWFLRYQLASVEGVAEVASVGGFVKQYQITVDPHRLHAYNLSISDVAMAVQRSNGEVGGRSVEMAEKEFILRVHGYLTSLDDLRKVSVGRGPGGTPILLGTVADVQFGPDMRRGIAELNGEGETVGGVVVVRYGVDTRSVIQAVKSRLDEAMKSLLR